MTIRSRTVIIEGHGLIAKLSNLLTPLLNNIHFGRLRQASAAFRTKY